MSQALELMAVGMGVVFAFLVLMVFTMYGAAAVIRKFEKPEALKPAGGGISAAGANELALVAVAVAAANAQSRK
ncbi:MAG: OadG family protein [Proteobacteria bacterium]|nr:OadG family protein [Pseudomonadota bacterium]